MTTFSRQEQWQGFTDDVKLALIANELDGAEADRKAMRTETRAEVHEVHKLLEKMNVKQDTAQLKNERNAQVNQRLLIALMAAVITSLVTAVVAAGIT